MDENDELAEGISEDEILPGDLPGEAAAVVFQADADPADADDLHHTTYLPGMYQNWFLDYASYVILDRAVPEVLDGLSLFRGESCTACGNWRMAATTKWPMLSATP